MLAELRIRDFAIIDELELRFSPGFSVLTGETGAGKSIIVDAVELVLGGRADSAVVRSGADRSLVEAVFRLDADRRAAVAPLLADEGLEGDDPGLLLIGREVRAAGRNVCRLNGRTVTLGLLRAATDGLVDIHGQSDHLSLLRAPEQLNLLDRYAGVVFQRQQVARLVLQLREVRRELVELLEHDQELAQRADLLGFQVREIEAAGLVDGEEKELLAERVRLANAEDLATLVADALQALAGGSDDGQSALDLVGAAVQSLDRLARVDATRKEQLEAGQALGYQVEALADGLRDYQERIELNPRRLAEVEDRLSVVRRLQRKYGPTVADVIEYASAAAVELDHISRSDERVAKLRSEEGRLLHALGRRASALSRERLQAAQLLAERVELALDDLRMSGSRFGITFEWREDASGVVVEQGAMTTGCTVTSDGCRPDAEPSAEAQAPRIAFDLSGIDRIEYLVSPNPGEPLKPVARIASGGETSRLMLALKSVLSSADETPTLIFDEIDQGIGGRVGTTVGEKLWALTSTPADGIEPRQVLCVTHLPQLAGFGDEHLAVRKCVVEGRTVTRVDALGETDRVRELAQMLGTHGEDGLRSAEGILGEIAERRHRLTRSGASVHGSSC